jgi:hypothetical protein
MLVGQREQEVVQPNTVGTTRYRYRGLAIPTPWAATGDSVDRAAGRTRPATNVDRVGSWRAVLLFDGRLDV